MDRIQYHSFIWITKNQLCSVYVLCSVAENSVENVFLSYCGNNRMEGRDLGHRNEQRERWSTIYKIIQQKPQQATSRCDACGESVPETYRTEHWWISFSFGLWKHLKPIIQEEGSHNRSVRINRTMSMSASHPALLSCPEQLQNKMGQSQFKPSSISLVRYFLKSLLMKVLAHAFL